MHLKYNTIFHVSGQHCAKKENCIISSREDFPRKFEKKTFYLGMLSCEHARIHMYLVLVLTLQVDQMVVSHHRMEPQSPPITQEASHQHDGRS